MDSYARASWLAFEQGVAMQAPSMVHRMSTDEVGRDAIITEIHRYFMDNQVTPDEVQRRLSVMFHIFNFKIKPTNS